METISISIAGRDYKVNSLTIRKSSEWRKQLGSSFEGLVDAMQSAPAVEVTNLASIGNIIESVKGALINSLDTVLDLVCAYAPEIHQDRARIEEEAYDQEIVEAFLRILSLAFPLGALKQMLNGFNVPTSLKG